MKQLLVENCINLGTVMFDLEGTPYTVKMFLLLLKGRGTTNNVKKRLLQMFGNRFTEDDREKALAYMSGVAHSVLGIQTGFPL